MPLIHRVSVMTEVGRASAEIAYCVPVMNRLADLQATLGRNLDVLRGFAGRARLIVGCFDATPACEAWVRDRFAHDLDSGLLQFVAFDPLPHWHFCWAKNAFREVISTDYYSSLDGDNFLTAGEVERTLEIIGDASGEVLIHHFSGNWGDGTSGRITLPVRVYREIPYDNELMPRQADEVSLILRVLLTYPEIRFLCRRGVDIFRLAAWCREFQALNELNVVREEVDLGPLALPANPRGEGYTHRDEKLFSYQQLNASYSGWKLSPTARGRRVFAHRLETAQRNFTRLGACVDELHALFAGAALDRLASSEAVTLYGVNRNNHVLLQPWIDHYRALGVERFILVDDGSDPPMADYLAGDDIHVVTPRFGSFRMSKVFWLKALMSAFQAPGSWVLTADSDEFLDVPVRDDAGMSAASRLSALTRDLGKRGRTHAAGLLLDMMPAPGAGLVSEANCLRTMDWFYYRPVDRDGGYRDLTPIQWGFGAFWPLSFAVDIRFRLYGTIDCLRKIPLFRFDPEYDLNQGFHALLHRGRTLTWDELLLPDKGLLPVRHYKMAKVFAQSGGRGKPFQRTGQYFDRTQRNLERIAGTDFDYVWRSWHLTPFKREYTDVHAFPFVDGFVPLPANAGDDESLAGSGARGPQSTLEEQTQ